jgi:penicillin-binding protein 1C
MRIMKQKGASSVLKISITFIVMIFSCFLFCLPSRLFTGPDSWVLTGSNGELLSATVAEDGQWRFPSRETVPAKFEACILTFEDKRFYLHSGVDGIAVFRAAVQNVSHGKIVSGGSTVTMQVIRLSRRNKRTFGEKAIEMIMAMRLELTHSKKEILSLYASHAPFGGNVVGLDAAAWRYFGRSPEQLSWGEMATLAVLPNAPSLIHPGRNRELLLKKRNVLIDALHQQGFISREDAVLARLEQIPEQPTDIPLLAPHLLQRYIREHHKGARLALSTINPLLQKQVNNLMENHHMLLKKNGINNLAVLILDVESGETRAYSGNIYYPKDPEMASHVDIIPSPRSPGSVMKPLLYAAAMHDGLILPNSLIPDIPVQIGGYTPRNFNDEFDGAVQASGALSRSLNIPAVKILQQYKHQRFYNLMKTAGISTFHQPADHYGLSIILGGAEVSMWDIAGIYASMARTMNHQYVNNGKVLRSDFHPATYLNNQVPITGSNTIGELDITSIWYMFKAMKEVARPGDEALWEKFLSGNNIYWKTGTSFGFRDAWSIGVTTKYVVAVWAGNADGEGRPGLTGIQSAAPLMFDVFRLLPDAPAFSEPAFGKTFVPVCGRSGFRAGPDCEDISNMMVPENGARSAICPYHKKLHLDKSGKFQVNSSCYPVYDMQERNWFILPPTMEAFYVRNHHDYSSAPPFLPHCDALSLKKEMDIIYPDQNARIYIPVELDGRKGKTVFTAAHSNPEAKIYWHLDDSYIGITTRFHQLGLDPAPGRHRITVTDEKGESVTRWFTIMEN